MFSVASGFNYGTAVVIRLRQGESLEFVYASGGRNNDRSDARFFEVSFSFEFWAGLEADNLEILHWSDPSVCLAGDLFAFGSDPVHLFSFFEFELDGIFPNLIFHRFKRCLNWLVEEPDGFFDNEIIVGKAGSTIADPQAEIHLCVTTWSRMWCVEEVGMASAQLVDDYDGF